MLGAVDQRVAQDVRIRQMHGATVGGKDHHRAAVQFGHDAGEALALDLITDADRLAGLQHDAGAEVVGDPAHGEEQHGTDDEDDGDQWLELGAEERQRDADAEQQHQVFDDADDDQAHVVRQAADPPDPGPGHPLHEAVGDPGRDQGQQRERKVPSADVARRDDIPEGHASEGPTGDGGAGRAGRCGQLTRRRCRTGAPAGRRTPTVARPRRRCGPAARWRRAPAPGRAAAAAARRPATVHVEVQLLRDRRVRPGRSGDSSATCWKASRHPGPFSTNQSAPLGSGSPAGGVSSPDR